MDHEKIPIAIILFCAGFMLGFGLGEFPYQKTTLDETKLNNVTHEVNAAELFVEGDAFPMCTAGDYTIWADSARSALMTCINGVIATLGPTSGLYFDSDEDTIYMYTREGAKVEYVY